MAGPKAKPLDERIRANVVVNEHGCWIWQRGRTRSGYGYITVPPNRGTYRAHRVAYATFVGPIPAGLVIDHLCGARSCVNPAHLEAVTQGENARRARARMDRPEGECPTCGRRDIPG